MYEKELKAAGLDEKQAKIYLACLEMGPQSVPAIARHAGVKRTTVYGILDELISLGFIQTSYRKKTKLFTAQDPEYLISELEERKQKIQAIMPGLSELFITNHVRPKIQFFEGKEGVRKIYDDILECRSKEVKQIVRAQDHTAAVGEDFIKEYVRKRAARNITAYDIHPKSGDIYTPERGRQNLALKRHVRYLPPGIFHAAMIMIYDHKVAMVATKKENFGFIIESKEFSNTLSSYFDLMWDLGSKTPEV